MPGDLLSAEERGSIPAAVLATLASSLEQVEAHLPQALMPRDCLPSLRQIAHLFPTSAVDFFGFECRLGGEGPGRPRPVDCALNLTAEGARLLAESGEWERVRGFYREWGETRLPPFADAGCTWLEFDAGAGATTPNLLFGYWPERKDSARPWPWLADRVLPMLLGQPVSPRLRSHLARCLDERPAGTGDLQIGVMLSRPIQAVRVCVFDLPAAEVFPYLERIGWAGPRVELERFLELLRPHADFLGLHLDVGEQVYPQIGIEPNFTAGCWSRQPRSEPRWQEQFERLLEHGLMSREEREDLLRWTGHQKVTLAGREVLLLRGLSHLKVTLRPGGRPAAKIYFGIAHRLPANPPARDVARGAGEGTS